MHQVCNENKLMKSNRLSYQGSFALQFSINVSSTKSCDFISFADDDRITVTYTVTKFAINDVTIVKVE